MVWINALMGGMLIGTAASVLWWFNGKVAGVSGILGGLLRPRSTDFTWQLLFLIGLIASTFIAPLWFDIPAIHLEHSSTLYIIAGLLVGFGTRLGSGCTSGHAICGNARFSKRSGVATVLFMLFGFFTVTLMRHVV